MKKSNRYSRKIRQFKFLAKTVNRLLDNQQFQQLSSSKRQKMIAKLQDLYQKVRPYLGTTQARKAMAGAAVFLGLAVGSVQAQFAEPVDNPFNLQGISGIELGNLVDIDGDGDLDLMTTTYDNASYLADVRFYENTGTPESPEFSNSPQSNPFNIDLSAINTESIMDFDFADMDNDGDLDMLLGSYGDDYDGQLRYFENVGSAEAPDFAAPALNAFGLTNTYQSALPTVIDIDNDGDFDVLVSEYYGNIQYFENTGTAEAPSFAAPVANPFGINLGANVTYVLNDFADIDGDGDLDLLASVLGYYNLEVVYQENVGTAALPDFAPQSANPINYEASDDEFFVPEMADLDNDGDTDVLLNVANTSTYGSTWVYYENLDIMSTTNDLDMEVDLQLSPNPVRDLLTINADFENPVEKLSIEIYDASGRQVFMENSNNHFGELNFQTNTSAYANGLYLVKIQADGRFSTLKFLKE